MVLRGILCLFFNVTGIYFNKKETKMNFSFQWISNYAHYLSNNLFFLLTWMPHEFYIYSIYIPIYMHTYTHIDIIYFALSDLYSVIFTSPSLFFVSIWHNFNYWTLIECFKTYQANFSPFVHFQNCIAYSLTFLNLDEC